MSLSTKRVSIRTGNLCVLALLAVAFSPVARAALWDNSRWAVSAATEAGVGYDDNLFSRAGSDGAGYLRLTPAASLRRLNSLTHLEVRASVRSYTFIDHHDLNSLDPALDLKLRYPAEADQLALQELEAHVSRQTESNADVGGRLRRDNSNVRWEGSFSPTGKITLLGRAGLDRTDYLTRGYNTNDAVTAGVTAAYVSNERLQLGAGYDYTVSRSRPDNAAGARTTGRQHAFTLRGRGEFLPKVTGYAFVGVSNNDYRGAVDLNKWDLVASVSLAWQATARGTLNWRVNRLTYFSADGSDSTHSNVGLEWQQEIAGGFAAVLGAEAGTVKYVGINSRTTHQVGGHFELRYALTEQFDAGFAAAFLDQDSVDPQGDYDHTTLFLNTTYKF